jgi:hypothetical protein
LSPKTAGTYKVAVYTSSTDATADLVTIVVDSAGVATATSATPLTAAYDANAKAAAFGKGPKGPKGEKGKDGRGHGRGHGHGPKGGENGGSGWAPPATGTTPAPTAPTV